MSLINKMLQDLERRQALFSGPQDAVLEELNSVAEDELSRQGATGVRGGAALWLPLLIVCLLVFLLAAADHSMPVKPGGWFGRAAENPAPSRLPGSGPAAAGKAAMSAVAQAADMGLKLDTGAAIPKGVGENAQSSDTGLAITSVDVEEGKGALNIVMGLPRQTKYLIYTLNDPNRVVLELNHSRYDGTLPDISSLKDVNAIRQRVEPDGTYRLVVETMKQMLIGNTDIKRAGAGYRLQVSMKPKQLPAAMPAKAPPAPEVSQAGTFHMTPANVADDGATEETGEDAARIQKMVEKGRSLYEDGEIDEGMNRLFKAVKQAPGNVNARSVLAVMLYEQGRDNTADLILTEGLRAHPHQSQWAMILARAMYSEGELDKARDILEKSAPPMDGHLQYHALYAAVLQKQGEYAKSAVVYRNLLRHRPSDSLWWMGLAISLEAMSRKNDAIVAYRNALDNHQLNAESLKFVKDKLKRLNKNS